MSDIFISYAREDRERAHQLAQIFEQQQWTVWWDREIGPGKKYAQVISDELSVAKSVIVIWSEPGVSSDWVKDEAQEGANRGILIPVLMEQVTIPYGFRQIQAADLSEWDGTATDPEMKSLLAEVARVISKPTVIIKTTPFDIVRKIFNRHWMIFLGMTVVIALIAGYVTYKKPVDQREQAGTASQQKKDEQPPPPKDDRSSQDNEARLRAVKLTADGIGAAASGNNDGAILMYDEAVNIKADYAEAYFYRAQSHAILKNDQKAIADFKKALELLTDEDKRKKAQDFLGRLTNVKARLPMGDSAELLALVNKMFDDDKATRIEATTKLIIERKNDPQVVPLAVDAAIANPSNKSGVINTLVLLESIAPQTLRNHQAEINKLLDLVKENGRQTVEHSQKVRDLLKS